MRQLRRIRWGWVLVGGLVAEIALLLFVPLQFLPGGQTVLLYLVVPLCLVATGLAGYWIARKADAARVLHGGLVGAVALVIYLALTWNQELPALYEIANYLKVAGGLAGGWAADRLARSAAAGTTEARPT